MISSIANLEKQLKNFRSTHQREQTAEQTAEKKIGLTACVYFPVSDYLCYNIVPQQMQTHSEVSLYKSSYNMQS